MKQYLLSIIIILLGLKSFAQTKPTLFVNPDGHKGQVRTVLVTSDKKFIVTGGFDKTIKVWDIEAEQLSREIFGEIGTGSNGMIYCMDLSPDNKYLAVGGWFGNTDAESENLGDIRIFDFATGKMAFVLSSHTNVIHDLKFTDDGKYLISGSGESELFLWDLASKKIIRKYNHTDKKLDVKFSDEVRSIATQGNKFVTADQYGRIKLWDINKSDTIASDHYYEQIQADGVAISPDGKYIAAAVDTFMTIYDANMKPLTEATSDLGFVLPVFSPDGTKLFFGTVGRGDKRSCNILSIENGVWTPYAEFTDIDNSVIAAHFIDNERVALAGGAKDEVTIIKIRKKDQEPKVIKRMVGLGTMMFAAAISDKKLAYSNVWTENFGFSKLNKQFDLFVKNFEKPDENIKWNKPVLENGDFTLKRYRIGNELNAGLYIKKNGKIFDSIPLEYWNGSEHHTFSFVGDYVVTGNCCGLLRAYNYDGLEVSTFVGHVGIIKSITISPDGTRMITASDDRTIKIWPINEIGMGVEPGDLPTVEEYCKKMNVLSTFGKVFKDIGVEKESKIKSRDAWIKVINAMKKFNYSAQFLKSKFTEYCSNEIKPIASIFLAENGEWLIWNENGYFASSKKGSRFVGYHINQGKTKEAKYYPFEQFDLKYNRPDIILEDLGLASIDVIKAYHLAYEKRLKRMGMTIAQLSDDIHLPELLIKSNVYDEKTQKVKITIDAKDDKYTLDRINVYVNDVPVYGTNGISIKDKNTQAYAGDITVELSPGKNKIQVSVLNTKGVESLKETFNLLDKEQIKPDLYIISIGVSNYADKNFNLNYAAKDADDVAKFFEKSELYGRVLVKELTNEQVTKEAILALKSGFLSQAQTKDLVMVFVAGHGVLDKNMNYYFGTHNMNFNDPAQGGIAYEELEEILNGIKPLKKLFFMDSCHSGELDKDDFSVTASNTTTSNNEVKFRNAGNVAVVSKQGMGLAQSSQLATDLFADLRRGTGATIISSAGGAEFAMESKTWNNGLFTFCFLSGMKEKLADKNNDGVIMLSEIEEYVHDKVTELSGGKQVPTARRENLEFDYRLW